MRAIVLERYGGPEVLQLAEARDPAPGADEVLIRVVAAGVNRADAMQRHGRDQQPDARPALEILGVEVAGIVERTGERVSAAKPGDRVMALLPAGGYAEYAVAHAQMLMPVPAGMSLAEAASIPEAFFTAYDALVLQAACTMGDTVLVHAGGSGVGVAALQLARASGARVLCTVGSEEKAARAKALGAEPAINYRAGDFAPVVQEATAGRGADIILDFIGGPYLAQNLACAAFRGRIAFVGLLGGASAELNLGLVMRKRLRLFGTTLRPRPPEARLLLTQEFIQHVLPLFRSGALRPLVDRVFPIADAGEAHRYIEANRNFGKVVLQIGEEP